MRRATYYLNSGREVDIHVDNNVFIAQDGYLDQKHTFDHFPTWQEVSAIWREEKAFIQVEYDPDYSSHSKFVYIPVNKNVETEFERITGFPQSCIIHYCPDELCNESGEPL